MWSFQDNYLHTLDEKPARPEPINVQAPVSISNIIPRSITEEQRDLWHTMLADVDNNIGTKTREEVYEEQKKQFYNDYYAGLEERLVSGKSQPTPSELYAFRLAREKWETRNLVGIENAYEYELANRKAFWDIMENPEEYQYAKTGDTVEDTTNALTNDLILTRALYNKTKKVSLAEEILAQFAQESAAGYAGGTAGAAAGGTVGGPVGAAVGAYVGANESIYQYRKAKIGHGTPSVNSVAEKFLEEYNALCNLYLNKTDFNRAVVGLVDKYLIDRNREYWEDISSVILSGQRSFLDMGPLTGLLIGTGLKGIKGVYRGLRPALGPKTMKQATQQAVKDAQDLQIYKQRKADGEDIVYDGEIISGQILKNSDNASPNAGMSQEGITIDAESWTTYEPSGEIVMTYVNPETGDVVKYSSFRSIGSGPISFIEDMKKQNMMEEVGTPVGVKDIDSTLNDDVVTLIGTGADYTQPFESIRAAEKALANWNIQLKDNQVPVVVEQGTDQYYIGVVDAQEPYFDLGIKNVERSGDTTIFWHDREFDNFEDALEYRNDLREMELEEQGLTPVSAGSPTAFREFKNKNRTGWDRDSAPLYGDGNYASVDNKGNIRTSVAMNKDNDVTGEVYDIRPDSREMYFPESVKFNIIKLLDSKSFENFVKKNMPNIDNSRFKFDRSMFAEDITDIFATEGPSAMIEHLTDTSKPFSKQYEEYLNTLDVEQADIERYRRLMSEFVLKNKRKLSANLMSSSVKTEKMKPVLEKEYEALSKEASKYIDNLDETEQRVHRWLRFKTDKQILAPVEDGEGHRISTVQMSIIDKLFFKHPEKYSNMSLQEVKDALSKTVYYPDIELDINKLQKDYIKEYNKLLKNRDLSILLHGDDTTIVVSDPKEFSKVSKIETITADGKYVQEVVDNDYVIRYNKKTGKYEIGEVRGGEYILEQNYEDIKKNGNK